jgi:glycosyltransferase involved in cell wall biosynthesis/2-polyprenyl-3-methyl-5-hydroxy-6-metoxy-1,4-benzoquinol methylase
MADAPRIGYLVKAFPVVSETFILNEVRALESHGVPLTILALKPPPRSLVHAAASEVESPYHEAPWERLRDWPRLFADHFRLCLAGGFRYGKVLADTVGKPLGAVLRRPSALNRRRLQKQVRRFAWAGWAARRAATQSVHHLHAHYAGEPLRVAHLVHRLTGIPYSFTAHAKDLYLAPAGRLRRRLTSAAFAVACHCDGAATLRELLPEEDRAKVHLVRHGIDTETFRPRRRRRTEPRILAVGRLTPKKGFDDLVAACSKLAKQGLRFRCDILGDGHARPALERLIRRHHLEDRVVLHGFVPQEDLPSWYSWATVVAMPSKVLADGNRDGVPNVLVEAMASGAAIVASATAGIPELLEDGVNGVLAPPGDPAALASALARVLGDTGLRERLGSAAAAATEGLDYRRTNLPLAELMSRSLAHKTDSALAAAEEAAWKRDGLAAKARKRLGRRPRRSAHVETAIRRGIRPGLEANAWRPDLERLAGRRLWDEAIKARRLPRLLPLLIGPKDPLGGRVLDLGCGRGGLCVALNARGLRTTAVDLRFRNCAVTRSRGERYGLQASAVTSLGEHLPFADDSFDAVACLEVLEHVQDPIRLLREIRRVLTPDGRCVATIINRWAHLDPHYHLWGLNFLPRGLANRYIALRRRTKRSYRDCQTLDEMHYYGYREFLRLAAELGFSVHDPSEPEGGWRRLWHLAKRAVSLGFNSVTLVLEPAPPQEMRVSSVPPSRRRMASRVFGPGARPAVSSEAGGALLLEAGKRLQVGKRTASTQRVSPAG